MTFSEPLHSIFKTLLRFAARLILTGAIPATRLLISCLALLFNRPSQQECGSEPQNSRYAAFIQDDWNATPNLTLNVGLRYEYAGLFVNGRGDMANFYPDLGKVVLLQGTGDPRLLSTLPIVDGQSVGLDPGTISIRTGTTLLRGSASLSGRSGPRDLSCAAAMEFSTT